jgi:hypothetical protein
VSPNALAGHSVHPATTSVRKLTFRKESSCLIRLPKVMRSWALCLIKTLSSRVRLATSLRHWTGLGVR